MREAVRVGRRSGFARDRDARQGGDGPGAVLHDRDHQVADLIGRIGAQRRGQLLGSRRQAGLAAGDAAHQVRSRRPAAVGDRRGDQRHPNRRDEQAGLAEAELGQHRGADFVLRRQPVAGDRANRSSSACPNPQRAA